MGVVSGIPINLEEDETIAGGWKSYRSLTYDEIKGWDVEFKGTMKEKNCEMRLRSYVTAVCVVVFISI